MISATDAGAGQITITYTLDVPAGTYRVEFFKNPTLGASTSGYGEGETFMGYDTFTSTGTEATKTVTLTGLTTDVVTATATQDLGGGSYGLTSEFSNAIPNGINIGTAPGSQTALADGGAYHIITGAYLGTCIRSSTGAYSEPTSCAANNGVSLASSYTPSATVHATLTANHTGYLNAWINTDNASFDTNDQIVTNQAITAGSNTITFTAPATVGTYYLRFRYTTYNPGTLLPTGEALDGEVLDVPLTVAVPQVAAPSATVVLLFGCKDPKATNYNPTLGIAPDNAHYCVYATATTPSTPTTTTTPATTTTTSPFTKNLYLGMNNTDVLALEKFLNSHGYQIAATGYGAPGNETIHFGPKTKAALIKFQKANNITPASGYFGPKTMGVVNGME